MPYVRRVTAIYLTAALLASVGCGPGYNYKPLDTRGQKVGYWSESVAFESCAAHSWLRSATWPSGASFFMLRATLPPEGFGLSTPPPRGAHRLP
jgi:hypothetical protein